MVQNDSKKKKNLFVLLSFIMLFIHLPIAFLFLVIGMDSSHHPMVGEPYHRQHAARYTEEAGGVSRLPPPAQTTQTRRQGKTGDDL